MKYENIVGLFVTDDEMYSGYRQQMTPLLESYGGGFRYDFRVAQTLINESGDPINRVFAIYFGDKKQMDCFFADPDYLRMKETFFIPSVQSVTIISEYET